MLQHVKTNCWLIRSEATGQVWLKVYIDDELCDVTDGKPVLITSYFQRTRWDNA